MTAYRALVAAVVVFCIALSGAVAWFVAGTPGSVFKDETVDRIEPLPGEGEPVLFIVERGESPRSIGAQLAAEGIIRSGRLFEVLVGVTGVANALEAGEYEFDRGMPAIEVVNRIASGKTASRQITIPEGRRVEEVGELLEANGIVTKDQFLAALVKSEYDEPFLQQIASDSLQGFIFPARYEFNRSTTPEQVVATMLRGFQQNVVDVLQFEGQTMTLEEIVNLAAIVEREAVVKEEQPLIAGVFLNRIRLGIPLGADPTVQFAVAFDDASVSAYGYWKQELTFDDLQIDSPYNTYVYGGLPPGPIANPGFGAIEAVVRPETTNYLFFVSKNDGTHVFAETLEEHERNVQQYQR